MNQQTASLLEARILHQQPARRAPTPPHGPAPDARTGLRILVVENEARAAESLVMGLRRHGYEAESVNTGARALQAHTETDLVLLDLDLPDLDGLEVCRGIRAASDTPIIAITARDTELDRVLGLQAGSDDYMVKPYGFRELMARIEAVMRRVRPRPPAAHVITSGPLTIDARTRQVRLDGRPVEVTRKEFDLLYLLASQPETVVSRKQLMTQVWDDSWSRPGRTIDTHVSSLRGKLGSSSWIITVRGVGFRFGHA
ncbi:DNA-binding response regulator [Streptomyces sp. CC53]|uniref:response regulator transcription factor n=1 Tax=unclassified Streptomyces TaxID=2593676 RepID=UPI0008DC8A2D|nr:MULTISPECIES: response regulator transcription factor [unclassified Streptomyces]OII65747.1 DNA-binding response regulator [Streptomyces sp. CC53]